MASMGKPRYILHPATLNPPALTADEEDPTAEHPPRVLLGSQAYVAKRENATTAFCKTRNGKEHPGDSLPSPSTQRLLPVRLQR